MPLFGQMPERRNSNYLIRFRGNGLCLVVTNVLISLGFLVSGSIRRVFRGRWFATSGFPLLEEVK